MQNVSDCKKHYAEFKKSDKMRTYHMIPFVWNSRIKTNVYWQKADQWLPEAKSGITDLEEGHRETVYFVLDSSGLFVFCLS